MSFALAKRIHVGLAASKDEPSKQNQYQYCMRDTVKFFLYELYHLGSCVFYVFFNIYLYLDSYVIDDCIYINTIQVIMDTRLVDREMLLDSVEVKLFSHFELNQNPPQICSSYC